MKSLTPPGIDILESDDQCILCFLINAHRVMDLTCIILLQSSSRVLLSQSMNMLRGLRDELSMNKFHSKSSMSFTSPKYEKSHN